MLCLRTPTDARWAAEAARHLDTVLVDHAHCELKAASNALSLAARPDCSTPLARALAEIAAEEVAHFHEVLVRLEERGLSLGRPLRDTYAQALRTEAHALGPATEGLVDRLLIGALIEARSCERFRLLGATLDGPNAASLGHWYASLFAAEARHYRTFIHLAAEASAEGEAAVLARLDRLAEAEARVVLRLAADGPRPAIHG